MIKNGNLKVFFDGTETTDGVVSYRLDIAEQVSGADVEAFRLGLPRRLEITGQVRLSGKR